MPVKRAPIIVEPKVKAFMSRRETIQVEGEEAQAVTEVLNREFVRDGSEVQEKTKDIAVMPAIGPVETFSNNSIGISRTTLFHQDKIEPMNDTVAKKPAAGVTNSKLEKKGRTKKERKSTKGRKTKGGKVREPLQLSLDVRTIEALNAMGVNKSQLFEDLLHQYEPFLEVWSSLHNDEE